MNGMNCFVFVHNTQFEVALIKKRREHAARRMEMDEWQSETVERKQGDG